MKKAAILALFLIIITSTAFGADNELIIPQKDKIYKDLSAMAAAGMIKSVKSEYFLQNAITKYEAASYINEAATSVSATAVDNVKNFGETLKKYEKQYASEMEQNSKNSAQAVPAAEPFNPLQVITGGQDWLEKEYSQTTFTDSSPFKITGQINGKYQQIESFGIAQLNEGAMSGTELSLYTEADLTDKIKLNVNYNLEMPSDDPGFGVLDSNGSPIHMFYGVNNPLTMDIYTATLGIYGWIINAGFFWEDITTLIAAQGQTQRIGIFDRDKYAGEETTSAHWETIFRNYFQNRDYRWSKHQFKGLEIYKDSILGRDIFKAMGGKTTYNSNYLYEFAGKYTHYQNFPFLTGGEWSANFYYNANEKSELEPFYTAGTNISLPDSLIQNMFIYGADIKTTAFNAFKVKGEFERSRYNGKVPGDATVYPVDNPQAFTQQGNALIANFSPAFLPKGINLELIYTRIDPDYVAPASAVFDTSIRVTDTAGKADILPVTYAADPTALYNNMNKFEADAYVNVPNGLLMLNYGISSQIRQTGSMFQSSHWLTGTEWLTNFYSNWGFVNSSDPNTASYYHYNLNRYGYDSSAASTYDGGKDYRVIEGGKGGLTIGNGNTEYMVSNAVNGNTIKTLSNFMVLFRYELSKLIRISSPLLLELYGELINLSNDTDIMVNYDPNKLLSQNMMSACMIYNIIPRVSLLGFFGLERWGANTVTPHPIEYLDTAYGVGADYDLAGRAFLYLRLKQSYHQDMEVPVNDFRGWRIWVELKSFF
jgi:hypothetical protein